MESPLYEAFYYIFIKYGHALFWRGNSHQNKTPVDHSIGHIPFASLEGDKRPGKINQNQESLNISCPKQENYVSIFRVPPLIKIICLFAAERGFTNLFTHD